jgi:alpha-ketoglutarate-dependent taurine dioxygenase
MLPKQCGKMQMFKRIARFGAIFENINLKNITCEDTLKNLLWEHKVLCFRNQFLSQKDFIRVGKLIGNVSESKLTKFHVFVFISDKVYSSGNKNNSEIRVYASWGRKGK